MEFQISRRIFVFLVSGIFLLVGINILDVIFHQPFWTITKIFYLGFDDNFSAWYSSILLFIAGLLAYTCWKRMKATELLWFSLLLFLMSADEISQFHETLGHLVVKYLHISDLAIGKYFCHSGWVWVFGPLVIFIFIWCICCLYRVYIFNKKAWIFLLFGFVLIIIGGVFLEATINFLNHGKLQFLWDIEVIFEEAMEMLGSVAVAYSLALLGDMV